MVKIPVIFTWKKIKFENLEMLAWKMEILLLKIEKKILHELKFSDNGIFATFKKCLHGKKIEFRLVRWG